ncbi:MAG: helix-turn-helix domain-containing protein [Pseudomonadota bacterium]
MDSSPKNHFPEIDFHALGERLRAYRIGASMTAEQIAEGLDISRAAVYRMEKGEIVKIETIQRLANLLDVSLASMLGVEVEYYPTALGYFERMRQLEQNSVRILAHFEPVSFLLTSDDYASHLRQMLIEAVPGNTGASQNNLSIDQAIAILSERKVSFDRLRQPIVSLIGMREIERFIHLGLVGRLDLPADVKVERIRAARKEVERIATIMENEPMGIQIGIVDDNMPSVTFQIFQGVERTHVSVSPFRLGELPNIRTGIATVTSSPDAVNLYQRMVEQLWQDAYKGAVGAKALRKMLDRTKLFD